MDQNNTIETVCQFCIEHANEENVKKRARYFKDEFHGKFQPTVTEEFLNKYRFKRSN